jgi:hypothetical protein
MKFEDFQFVAGLFGMVISFFIALIFVSSIFSILHGISKDFFKYKKGSVSFFFDMSKFCLLVLAIACAVKFLTTGQPKEFPTQVTIYGDKYSIEGEFQYRNGK